MQNSGIRLMKLFGIEIRLDYSWFIIFFLIGWTFTVALFPNLFPELGPTTNIILGILATLLFFASIVIHELSHSLYARSQGLKIRRITLFIFGGAAEIMSEAKTPRQEFIMAGVGPLTSFILGVVFAIVWMVGLGISYLPFVAVGSVLATVNVVLAIFNLLPGFPLDGGRMFKAVVWKTTGSLEKSVRYAANGGRILSYALMFVGMLQILATNLFGGLWLILIGFFLNYAATANQNQTLARIRLKNVKVEDLMGHDFDEELAQEFVLGSVETLHPKDTALKALNTMSRVGRTRLPVVDGDELIGVLTIKDIQKRLSQK
jgi:Zn-dependent protease